MHTRPKSTLQQNSQIRSRAPLRLGLAGGGTDVSPFSDEYGGLVLNATIDKFAYCFLSPAETGTVQFIAHDLGIREVHTFDDRHYSTLPLHLAVYNRMISHFNGNVPISISIATSVDAPPGSGLGSSSALVVAMVSALEAALDCHFGPYERAQIAFQIERVDLQLAGGKQDHYAAAFGGLNFIEFQRDDRVVVNPLRIGHSILKELEASIITCFSGQSRRSESIIAQQQKGMLSHSTNTIDGLLTLKRDAEDMKIALLRGQLGDMAGILSRSWRAKQSTAQGISTPQIDNIIESALDSGATGGKVSGAGGGGFIMFMVEPQNRFRLMNTLRELGTNPDNVHFTQEGAECWISPATHSSIHF